VGVIIGFILISILIVFLIAWIQRCQEKRRYNIQANNEFEQAEKAAMRAINNRSLVKAQEALDEYGSSYEYYEPQMTDEAKSKYGGTMWSLQKQVCKLEKEKWEKKADFLLGKFLQLYKELLACEDSTINDPKELKSKKRQCLRTRESYFDLKFSEDYDIDYDQYFKDYLGADFDPCMAKEDILNLRLDDCIRSYLPEKERINTLYEMVLDYAENQKYAKRCALFNSGFQGYDRGEIEEVEKNLVKTGRICEYKMGNRWYVKLTDSEKVKREQKKNNV